MFTVVSYLFAFFWRVGGGAAAGGGIETDGVWLPVLKGEVSREFDVISKPKHVCLSTET